MSKKMYKKIIVLGLCGMYTLTVPMTGMASIDVDAKTMKDITKHPYYEILYTEGATESEMRYRITEASHVNEPGEVNGDLTLGEGGDTIPLRELERRNKEWEAEQKNQTNSPKLKKDPNASRLSNFKDIKNHPAKFAIETFVQKKYIAGYPDHTFRPNRTLTREECVTILYNMLGKGSSKTTFRDTKGRWSVKAIGCLTDKKIVCGYGNQRFGPTDKMSRQDFFCMAYNYLAYKGYVRKEPSMTRAQANKVIGDGGKLSDWSYRQAATLVKEGFITPEGSKKKLRGKDAITRAEAVQFLHQISKGTEVKKGGTNKESAQNKKGTLNKNVTLLKEPKENATKLKVNSNLSKGTGVTIVFGDGDYYLVYKSNQKNATRGYVPKNSVTLEK